MAHGVVLAAPGVTSLANATIQSSTVGVGLLVYQQSQCVVMWS